MSWLVWGCEDLSARATEGYAAVNAIGAADPAESDDWADAQRLGLAKGATWLVVLDASAVTAAELDCTNARYASVVRRRGRWERPKSATGDAALAEVARRWPDVTPRAALRALLTRLDGNAVRAARELGVSRAALVAALAFLPPAEGGEGELAWLRATWPDRRVGGRPRQEVR